MFIVNLSYIAPMEKVDAFLDEHIKFLKSCYADGTFIASGRKEPRTGGIILASCESVEALEDILADDPFWKNSIAEYDVINFSPSMTAEGFENLIDK